MDGAAGRRGRQDAETAELAEIEAQLPFSGFLIWYIFGSECPWFV